VEKGKARKFPGLIGEGEMHGDLKLAFRQAMRLSSISELLTIHDNLR
jgi:hypothetical protein